MKRFTISMFVLAAFLVTFGNLQAQVLFTEKFQGSIPATWTNDDASVNDVKWEFCASPTATCVDLYGQTAFASTDATNGFAVLDSDAAGDLAVDHDSRLTSPAINCSGATQVFVTFDSYIGVFQHVADDLARLRVSTDGTNWTSFQIFTGLTGATAATRFSENPKSSVINISSVAAGQATVYLQWRWQGNYDYWWMLDNITVTTQDPSPTNNLAITDFFYPVSSYATPESQIATDTFSFGAEGISNLGTSDATNVKLTARVVRIENNQIAATLFEGSKTIDVLPAGYVDTAIYLDERFAPELPEGLYRIIYTVSSDQVDQAPGNNTIFDNFEVTDVIFSKEVGPTGGLRPGSGGDYTIANLYTMSPSSQETYKLAGVQFTGAKNTADGPLEGSVVTLNLWKVNDDVDAGYNNFDDTELFSTSLNWLASADYTFPAGTANYAIQSVELVDLITGEPSTTILEPGGRYFVGVSYADASNVIFQAFADRIEYKFVSTLVYSTQWFFGGFGEEDAAVIRMFIDLATSTDDKPLPANAVTVFPNPVSDVLNVKVDFNNPTDATITIAELSGRVITFQDRAGLTNENLNFNVANMAAGTYLVRVATKEGTKTTKFVVVK
jgi:hypothetical protein